MRRRSLAALRALPGCYVALAGLRGSCGGVAPAACASTAVPRAATGSPSSDLHLRNPALAAARAAVCRPFVEGRDFRIVKREAGSQRTDLPIFAAPAGAVQLAEEAERREVVREDFPNIPGAFLLHNVLTDDECDQIIAASEAMGYTEDAPVSLGRHIRQNDNCVWIADDELTGALFERSRPHLPEEVDGGQPVGLNARFRLYRYNPQDVFRAHTDGSWPGSGLDPESGRLVQDRYGDRWSQLTWVAYLNDDFEGGATGFLLPGGRREEVPARRGAVLCFFHGEHPLSPVHEGAHVERGTKYIIRSDVLYTLRGSGASVQSPWQRAYGKR